MSLATSPNVPAYWVQNFLIVTLGTLGEEWVVDHAYNIWSTDSSGYTTALLAGSIVPTTGTSWSPVANIGTSPPLKLSSTIATSGSNTTITLTAAIEETSGNKTLKPYPYSFPQKTLIMAATTAEQAQELGNLNYDLEPELMLVGPDSDQGVIFYSPTMGAVTAQFRFKGDLWQAPGTQYATQSATNPNLTPSNKPCSSTAEQSSGLDWADGNVSGPVSFQAPASPTSGTVQAEGLIFLPAQMILFLGSCQAAPVP
jgi:hypothetical protein